MASLPPDRFLRDPSLRAALYVKANGRCECCGEPLGPGWHADHVQPWTLTHRTNVFEMQALCAPCNEAKGDKTMLSISEFTFSMEKFRRGQLGAFEVTTKRIMQDREKHTAIVLPTRYGKTDFMLMSGLYLMEQKAVSGMLIMTPNQVLRNQAVDTAKLHKSLSRYGVSVERVLSDGRKRPGVDPYNIDAGSGARIEFMLDRVPNAVTTSMVMYNPGVFRHWIDHLQQAAGVPPVVFVDEAHTASNQSTWGQVIQHLGEAGAYIVLCTATPYRSDGLPIPGFEVTKHYEDELTRRDQVGAHFYQLHGRRVVYRLEAHHVTTFQEAWQESVLCGVTRETFDVNLREHGFDGYAEQWLSELPEHEARRALSRAIRSPIVIRDGVRKLLSNLRTRQKDAPETARHRLCRQRHSKR